MLEVVEMFLYWQERSEMKFAEAGGRVLIAEQCREFRDRVAYQNPGLVEAVDFCQKEDFSSFS